MQFSIDLVQYNLLPAMWLRYAMSFHQLCTQWTRLPVIRPHHIWTRQHKISHDRMWELFLHNGTMATNCIEKMIKIVTRQLGNTYYLVVTIVACKYNNTRSWESKPCTVNGAQKLACKKQSIEGNSSKIFVRRHCIIPIGPKDREH